LREVRSTQFREFGADRRKKSVGNHRINGVTLSTDGFIKSVFAELRFTLRETIIRNIPKKRMPRKNSPSNIVGKTDITMNEENIVVCERLEV